MTRITTLGAALLMSISLVVLSGCMKEGPAEKVGKSLDNAADSVGDHVEDAGEVIHDAANGNN